jgi:hypothetical protein
MPAREVHHIKPLSHGGTNESDNLMSLCTPCHSEITAREGGRWKWGSGQIVGLTKIQQVLQLVSKEDASWNVVERELQLDHKYTTYSFCTIDIFTVYVGTKHKCCTVKIQS